VTGERLGQAGWLSPSKTGPQGQGGGGRIHQFLWRRSRAVSKREKGTERQGAIRNRFESSQAVRESFEPGPIAVTRGYPVATVDQHGRRTLAVFERRSAKGKTPKGGTK